MQDATEDEIRPSHFRYARRDESGKSKKSFVPAQTHPGAAPEPAVTAAARRHP